MKGKSDNSFRARMGRAKEFLTYISGFENYKPPRPEENVESMGAIINELIDIMSNVASLNDLHKAAMNVRLDAFYEKDDSVQKLLVQIRAAIDALYGKTSQQATVVGKIIRDMRNVKVRKEKVDINNEVSVESVGRSEKSYGSVTFFFHEILATIQNYQDYATSNDRVSKESLKQTAEKLVAINGDVNKKYQDLDAARELRETRYIEFRNRTQRIKAYVRGQYGLNSKEYNLIRGLRF